jgi:hypothetical protein
MLVMVNLAAKFLVVVVLDNAAAQIVLREMENVVSVSAW